MILKAGIQRIEVEDAADFTRLYLDGGGQALGEIRVLIEDDASMTADPDDQHVWVSIARLELAAERAAAPEWREKFAKMVDYAATSGWTSDDGTQVRAHIENVR